MTAVAVIAAGLPAAAQVRSEQPAGGGAALPDAALRQAVAEGYRRYNGACSHCHGPDGIGSTFAPSLIERPLPFTRFREIVERGSASGTAVMRGFADDPNVAPYVRAIYLYLAARADGTVARGRPSFDR